jgi:leader peptidase (prepilin peptidase) / N-methyltransferase
MTAVAAVLAGCFGAAVGSFLNVVIWRLPRGESVVSPRSSCPRCGTPIRPRDNVPVLSWALLRGRCRDCGAPISARYPLVEALTALLCVVVVVVLGPGPDAWIGLALVVLLVPVTFIDLDHRIIPNKLLAVGAVAAVALVALLEPDALVEHLLAALAAGGFLLVAALAYPSGMGMGDVKLAAVLGLFLGAAVAPAMFAAMLAGSVVGAAIIARKGAREGRKTAIPFGPYLAFGGVVGVLWGEALVDWYLRSFV